MTAVGTVTIDRTSLSLSGLAITTDNTGAYTLAQGGLGRPGTAPREGFADDSKWINGRLRTSVVKEETTLPLVVRVQSTTSSGLNTAVVALETALWQFVYTVTVAVDGVSKVWTAYPASIGAADGGLVVPGRVLDHYEDLAITIPIYPVSA